MKSYSLLSVLAVVLFCGCGKQKGGSKSEEVIAVHTITVGGVQHQTDPDSLSDTIGADTTEHRISDEGLSPATATQTYSGTIAESDGSALSFALAGTLKTMHVCEGQFVRAGQLIATLDATTAGNSATMANATTRQAEDALAQAEDAYRRMKMLHDNGSLPEIQWIEIQTKVSQARSMVRSARSAEEIARKGVSDTRLTAPFSGYVSERSADAGQNVAPGIPIIRLVRIDQVKVKISVPENEIARFRQGQRFSVRVSALDDRLFEATVVERGVSADPLSRSYEVKAVINNPRHELLPGMVCEVVTHHDVGFGSTILLPATLIQIDTDNRPFVWTVDNGRARKTTLTLSGNASDQVIVSGGLARGTHVISEGQQKVSQGTKVKEVGTLRK